MKTTPIELSTTLSNIGIETLNPMQQSSIEAHAEGHDILLLSPTGSGKTLAFLLPLLSTLEADSDRVQALIIAPSRELALQIESVFLSLRSGYKICCCYGGHSFAVERRSLEGSPTVVVGTPGRLLDHIDNDTLTLDGVKTLILDEFDKSLEMGFQGEMSRIIPTMTQLQQRVLTSATQAIEIPDFVAIRQLQTLDYLSQSTAAVLTVRKVFSDDKDKLDTLYQLLCQIEGAPTIIFCNYRESVERVSQYLSDRQVDNEFFHGGMEQVDRERALCKFRNGSSNLFISTDLAARGLDIPEIKYIIHYHIPSSEEAFTHRNGRTARMNADGTAYVLVYTGEQAPFYIDTIKQVEKLQPIASTPPEPQWLTLYIGRGKKNKLSRVDVVGFLCQNAGLTKQEIGRIEIKDFYAYVALPRSKAKQVLAAVSQIKIKGMSTKMEYLRADVIR